MLDACRDYDKTRKHNAEFIEQTQRHGQHDLRNHVRRCKNSADYKRTDNHIRPPFLEFRDGHNAHMHQDDNDHRHLEGDAEGNKGRQHKDRYLSMSVIQATPSGAMLAMKPNTVGKTRK